MGFLDRWRERRNRHTKRTSTETSLILQPTETAKERELREAKAELELVTVRLRKQGLERAYEAVKPSQYWKRPGDNRSANAVMDAAREGLRQQARYLDENHDIAVAVLDDLVNKTIGCGIQVTFQVKKPDGSLHVEVNKTLAKWWDRWTKNTPDTSRSLPWPLLEALVARTFFRDGELLVQHVIGLGTINHRTRVPYSIELIEGDLLPFDLNRPSTPLQNRVVHGVELNDWKEPLGYWVYKEHPGDVSSSVASFNKVRPEVKRVSADQISHVKLVRRLDQVRGVSVFHAVLRRLEDIKDYEESERVAARVAAAMCAIITKSSDFQGAQFNASTGQRNLEFNPGMIFDQLNPGEKVEMIGSNRPNANLGQFREDMLRAVAGGTGSSFSSISRNYNGSYSSQRQELVERWVAYEMIREVLYGMFYRPVTQRFVDMMKVAGLVNFAGADPESIFDVDFVGPAMPWINPNDEIKAKVESMKANVISRHMVIRENQLDPAMVDEQINSDPLHPKEPTPVAAPAAASAKPPSKPANPAKESEQ